MLAHAGHWTCAMLLAIVVSLSAVTAGQEVLKPVKIVTGQWKPYTDASDTEKGIATQVITAVLKKMGMQPNYLFMPFDQAISIAADSQRNDGVRGLFPLYDSPSRRRAFYFSDPLFPVTLRLYYHAGKSPQLDQIQQLDDLKGINSVFIGTYRYPDALEDHFPRPIKADNSFQAIQHLFDEDKEPCLVPMAEEVARSVINDYSPDKAYLIKAVPHIQFEMQLYFLASRRNPHNRHFVYDDFNTALRRVKEEGTLEAILTQARYKSLRRSLVRLTLPAGQGSITAKIAPEDPNDLVLPRGTQVEVLEWGRAFIEPRKGPSNDPRVNMSRIKIWNGPLKGKELYVDNRFIELP